MPSPSPRSSFFRTASQYLTEPHPFARRSVTMKAAPIVWANYPKRLGRTGVLVVPMAMVVLGWPMGAKWVVNGKM